MATAMILTFIVLYGMCKWAGGRWPIPTWVLAFLGLTYVTMDTLVAAYLSMACIAGLWGGMALWDWLWDLMWDRWVGDAYRRWIWRRWRDD